MGWFEMAAVSMIVTSLAMIVHMILSHSERED
jgi:hypothetical protein